MARDAPKILRDGSYPLIALAGRICWPDQQAASRTEAGREVGVWLRGRWNCFVRALEHVFTLADLPFDEANRP